MAFPEEFQGNMGDLMRQMMASDSVPLGRAIEATQSIRQKIARDVENDVGDIRELITSAEEIATFATQPRGVDLADYSSFGILNAIGSIVDTRFLKQAQKLERIARSAGDIKSPEYEMGGKRTMSMSDLFAGKSEARVQADALHRFSSDVGSLLVKSLLPLPSISETLAKLVTNQYRYYQKRFLNIGNQQDTAYQYPFNDDADEALKINLNAVPYIKTELIENNVVLTELALDIASRLPRRHKRKLRSSGRRKTIEKSEYDPVDVEIFAHNLRDLSSSDLLNYVHKPRDYLYKVASLLELYHKVMQPHHGNLVEAMRTLEDMGAAKIIASDETEGKFNLPLYTPSREVSRIRSINYLSIVPTEEETRAVNELERRTAATRKVLLEHIVESLKQIGSANEANAHNVAKEAVVKAIGLKEKMSRAMATSHSIRLDRDKKDLREFYVGTTKEHGEFVFVREATPDVKMDDIVGKSFDGFKTHLKDLQGYSRYGPLFRQTAPRGKIKTNLIAIGPYGCGKTEIARAIAASKNSIGAEVSVSKVINCWFGEFERNIERIWDQARELRRSSGESKIVYLLMDEFDSWFSGSQDGSHSDGSFMRVQKAMQTKLDGISDYDGIVVVGFTNDPKKIPLDIYRRFNFVDVVGQLEEPERATLLKKFLTRGLPLSKDIDDRHYSEWAKLLVDAPGDVIGKVADSIHYDYMRRLTTQHPAEGRRLNRYIIDCRDKNRAPNQRYLVRELRKYGEVDPAWVESTLRGKLDDSVIKEQIAAAVKCYAEAKDVLQGIHAKGSSVARDNPGFAMGLGRASHSSQI